MSHAKYIALLNQARKAGLNTREFYGAMAGRTPENTDQGPGQVDSNGFVSSYTEEGKRIYHPADDNR